MQDARLATRGRGRVVHTSPMPRRVLAPVLLALVCALLSSCGAPLALNAPRGHTPTTATPLPPPAPTADPLRAHNAELGCAPNAPAPLPGIVYGGNYKLSTAPASREVALTFDDGPTPNWTPRILTVLEQTHTPATFFVEGQYARASPDLLLREWNDGFAIAAHSWDHPQMNHLTLEQMRQQFSDTNAEIHKVIGASACLWLWRPPYASYNDQVLQEAQAQGLTTITWDDCGCDWLLPGAEGIANNVLNAAHPGAIVLLHDGPSNREQTMQAIPLILAGLQARGLTPVTLPRLLADAHYPGVAVQPAPTGARAPTVASPTITPPAGGLGG